MEKKASSFSWKHLFLGSLFIFASLIAFRNPVGSLITITIFFGIIAVLKGLFDIFVRNRINDLTGFKATSLTIVGVVDIILGLLLLFNINVGVSTLPFIFAIWFIIDSIEGLFTSEIARSLGSGYYWFTIILNILGIIIGFSLLFNPVASALTISFLIGFYLMIFGIMNLVEAFIRN